MGLGEALRRGHSPGIVARCSAAAVAARRTATAESCCCGLAACLVEDVTAEQTMERLPAGKSVFPAVMGFS